jgi:hypothetical protein
LLLIEAFFAVNVAADFSAPPETESRSAQRLGGKKVKDGRDDQESQVGDEVDTDVDMDVDMD